MITRDYLMRLLKQLIEGLARIAKLKEAAKFDAAHAAIADLCEEVIGHQPRMLEGMTPSQAMLLLRDWRRMFAWARLLTAEADVYRAEGAESRAAEQEAQALGMLFEAREQGARGRAEVSDEIDALHPRVDKALLDKRCAKRLAEWTAYD